MTPVKPGDAVLCIQSGVDPIQGGVKGIGVPIKGAVFTVEEYITAGTQPCITLVGLSCQGTDRDGQPCKLGWHLRSFVRLRAVDVQAVLQGILSGRYGERFDHAAIQAYQAEWRQMQEEAAQHRKAKW